MKDIEALIRECHVYLDMMEDILNATDKRMANRELTNATG